VELRKAGDKSATIRFGGNRMSDTISEYQGDRIISLLEKILKELEKLNSYNGPLDKMNDHLRDIESNTDKSQNYLYDISRKD